MNGERKVERVKVVCYVHIAFHNTILRQKSQLHTHSIFKEYACVRSSLSVTNVLSSFSTYPLCSHCDFISNN